ncbi:hypothetical protein QMO17_32705, partial [Klebsiella pneumoniae]|nr:hypothetical protein [Klebsiella pneumoniae]
LFYERAGTHFLQCNISDADRNESRTFYRRHATANGIAETTPATDFPDAIETRLLHCTQNVT